MSQDVFITNKYYFWYYNIITKALKRKNNLVYTEKHHIIPKSLGGSNKKENLVHLTAREHFICHWLLLKFTENSNKSKMVWAFKCLSMSTKTQKRYINSLAYSNNKTLILEETKKRVLIAQKKAVEKIKGKPKTEEHKKKISISAKKRWKDPKEKENLSNNMKKRWENEDYVNNMDIMYKEYWQSERGIKRKKEMSERQRGKKRGPISSKHREKISKKVNYLGVWYSSITEAAKINNVTTYQIYKKGVFR